jgi:cell division protein FtsQ
MANRYKKQKYTFNWNLIKQLSRYLLAVLTLVFVFYVANYLRNFSNIQLDETILQVQSDYSLNLKEALLKRIAPELNHNVFDIDLNKVRQLLQEHPWVAQANVKYQLLNDIHINVITHKIALRLNNSGYISDKGVLFEPQKKISNDYPLVLNHSNQKDIKKILTDFQQYQQILDSLNLTIKVLKQTPTTQLILQNNLILNLGYQQQISRLKKFTGYYPKLKKINKLDFHTIDLRYKNGFVIAKDIAE